MLGKPFRYTQVYYPAGSIFGLTCALASLLPIFLTVSFFTIAFCKSSGRALFMLLLAVSSEVIGMIMKKIIREPRPSIAISELTNGTVSTSFFDSFSTAVYAASIPPSDGTYGMPSTHSIYAASLATVVVCGAFIAARNRRTKPRTPSLLSPFPPSHQVRLAVLAVLAAAGIAYSRIFLGYHSPAQVIVGLVTGVVVGYIASAVYHFHPQMVWLVDEVAATFTTMLWGTIPPRGPY